MKKGTKRLKENLLHMRDDLQTYDVKLDVEDVLNIITELETVDRENELLLGIIKKELHPRISEKLQHKIAIMMDKIIEKSIRQTIAEMKEQ